MSSTALATSMAEQWVGIHDNLSNEEYHLAPGISASGLKIIGQKSLAHYQDYLKNPPEPSPEMVFGTVTHLAILEPELFVKSVCVAPECDRRTTAGKALYASFVESSKGKLVISKEDNERLSQILENVHASDDAKVLLRGGEAEVSAFWVDPTTGVLCKTRPDYLIPSLDQEQSEWINRTFGRETKPGDVVSINLKTASDASYAAFQRSVANLGYHWATAFAIEGLSTVLGKRVACEVHLVVESKKPYQPVSYCLDDASIEKARQDLRWILTRYHRGLTEREWTGYQSGSMNLPPWAW